MKSHLLVSVTAILSATQVSTGATLSLTVIVKLQEVLFVSYVRVYVAVVTPRLNVVEGILPEPLPVVAPDKVYESVCISQKSTISEGLS